VTPSRASELWLVGQLCSTAFKPTSAHSLNIQNGMPTSLWSDTDFFPVFDESAARLREGSHADTLKASKAWSAYMVATPLGFEPRITPPKGAVLPLHHGVCVFGSFDRRFSIQVQCRKFKGDRARA